MNKSNYMAKQKNKFKKIDFKALIIFFLFLSFTPFIFYIYKANSIQNIPKESKESIAKLNQILTKSKYDITESIKDLEDLNSLEKYTEYKKNYILARLYEKKGDYKKALSIYQDLLNKNYPLKERVLFHYAYLSTLVGNDNIAIKHFNKLLHNFPDSKSVPQTKYYLAQTNLRLKNLNQAISTLKSLRSAFPDTQYGIAADYYLGEYEYNKKNYEKAISFWKEYLKNSPDGRFAIDIADFYNYLKDNKNISPAKEDYTLLGNVFFHKKDYKQAAEYYKLANNSKDYYNLGYSLFRIGNREEAKGFLKEFAYKFPSHENSKLALFFAAECLSYNVREDFWKNIIKDVPQLAYYAAYKAIQFEKSDHKKEKLLKKFIDEYPENEFTLDAVWEIMWLKIEDKKYKDAKETGNDYFVQSSKTKYSKSDTRAKIGFFLGKISEILNNKIEALDYYNEVKNINHDNYYSLRASHRLQALDGKDDPSWTLQNKILDFSDFYWSLPVVTKPETIKNYFGSTVYELVQLQQFDEAIELIGKNESTSAEITAWLKALNEEYESSINLANIIAIKNNLSIKNSVWELAYPLYFWQYTLNSCKKYPGIDPLLVCGIIRQESRFLKDAISISNAHGLMQLIPPTARVVASQINLNLYSLSLLDKPDINISLGTHYLNGLIQEFNNPLLAVASYNAGPNAVKRWLTKSKFQDMDFFIETIPYFQTRDYVKKVFASYWTYTKLYS